ncbi:MAG: hypothetical protein IJN36_03750, partial [Clostridia bacterium]|nr:hypothetical protein [Clostridia bacterium]
MLLEHNSGQLIYRKPSGACPTGEKVRLRIAVRSYTIPNGVFCHIGNQKIPMYYAFEAGGSRLYECSVEMPERPGLVFYHFTAEADGEVLYYANNAMALGG